MHLCPNCQTSQFSTFQKLVTMGGRNGRPCPACGARIGLGPAGVLSWAPILVGAVAYGFFPPGSPLSMLPVLAGGIVSFSHIYSTVGLVVKTGGDRVAVSPELETTPQAEAPLPSAPIAQVPKAAKGMFAPRSLVAPALGNEQAQAAPPVPAADPEHPAQKARRSGFFDDID